VEGIKEEVVLSPGHALSFIAAGEGAYVEMIVTCFFPFVFKIIYPPSLIYKTLTNLCY